MATSSVDKNRKSESATRAREQAQKQEAELKKKHASEVNRLQKMHGEKVRELQKTHQNQLEAVRTRGQEALSEKDREYQGQIDKMKSTHSQATKNSAQNYDRQVRQIQDTYEGELNKTNQIHDSQMESLSKNYETDTKKREENYTKSVDYMRNEQADALGNQREKLESRYSRDQNILRDTQDGKINNLSNELQATRDQKNQEIKSLKVQNMSDRSELEADKMSLLTQERKTQEMHKDNMRDQYSKNLDEIRDKYGKANIESRTGRAVELDNMKLMAEEKNREQVGTLERRIREQNVKNDNERFLTQKSFNEEKKAYLNATKEALEKAELQRSMVYDSANARTAEEIKDITSRNNEIVDRQGKYYQERLGQTELKYGESIQNQVKSLEVENKLDRQKAEARQVKMNHLMGKEKNDMESYYQEMLTEKDRVNKDTMTEQRINMLKERNEAVGQLEGRLREVDAKNTEKTNQLIMKYEREISNMKDEHKAEKKRMIDQHARRLEEQEKTHRFQMESDKVASKAREDQLKEKFERNISQMEIKHDEEKIRMATILKK